MGARLVKFADPEISASGPFVDVIDASDPDLIFMEGQMMRETGKSGTGVLKSDIRIFVHNKPNAVDYAVDEVVRSSGISGKIGLLRFHGHGLSGYQSVNGRVMSRWRNDMDIRLGLRTNAQVESQVNKEHKNPNSRVAISRWNLGTIGPSISRLKSVFSDGAEVWLMGCWVGSGKDGLRLVNALAQILGVTVKAGSDVQFAGYDVATSSSNYLHEGPIVVGRAGK